MAALLRRRSATSATISVVVSVTDGNAPFLDECLGALTVQERRPDEVLLAVSGTGADTAASVAAGLQSAGEAGIGLVTLAGDADEGARRATGDYLLLIEAGDLLTPAALSTLAGSLDDSGSDLALPGARGRPRSTLADAPDAVSAVDLATTMLRAGFWRDAGLASLRDPVAEWLPAVHAVVRASAFDVVEGQVRRGARRGTGLAFSAMPGASTHLVRVLPAIDDVLGRLSAPSLRPARERLVLWLLSAVVSSYLEDAERCDDATWGMVVDFIRELLAELPEELVGTVPVEPRVRAWLAAADRRQELETFNAARWHEAADFPTRPHDGEVFAVLPVEDVPEEVLRLSTEETPLVTQLRRARWTADGLLELEVVAFTRKLGSEAGPPHVRLALESGSGRRVELEAEPLRATEVNPIAGERQHDHADGLFRTRVDAGRLVTEAAWSIRVDWERAGVRRTGQVRTVERRGSAAALAPLAVGDHELALDLSSARLVLSPRDPASQAPAPGPAHPELTGLRLEGDVLEVTGSATDGPHTLRLRGPRGAASVRVRSEGGTFTARLALRHDPWSLGETPLPPGSYRLRLLGGGGTDGPGKLVLGSGLAALTPYVEGSAYFRLRVERNPDASAQLVLGAPLADDEAGPRAQHELRRWYATDEHRLDPTTVYFQSYAGLSATDSPLAIHHELRRTRPDLRLVWGAVDSSVVVPDDAERLLLRGRSWYAELSRCGHIVTNVDMDDWFRKRPGQRLLQTYHGYPAKAMGVMAWEAKNFTPSIIERHLRRTSATWDLLLTPHPSMDVHYREQYRYTGPILSGGYPRDDELVRPGVDRLREETRRRLGIGDRTAVLYAPTWRDDLTTNFRAAVMPSTFDVETAAAALGEDYVILMRGHRFHRQRPEMRGRLVDVTNYPEINHLIVAADVAVLDYSSLRFDVALAGRPMIFLVPDLARYESGVRGFLYDFRSSAPGPLLDTTAEVVDALRDLEGVARRHRPDYERFHDRFNALQDGHATERVVQTFFG